jgi:hypothetical protein
MGNTIGQERVATFTISVNLPISCIGSNGQKVAMLKVQPNDTILSVKQKLQHIIPMHRQRLYDDSPALLADDTRTLSTCNITSGSVLSLRDSTSISLLNIHPSLRKRDIRQACRVLSWLAAGLLVLNILSLHTYDSLVFNAAICMVIGAIGNLFAAFVDEGSLRSFCASVTDLALAFTTVVAFLMQAAAAESLSRAWASGLTLLAVIIELVVIAWNISTSLIGQVIDEPLQKRTEAQKKLS